MSSGAGGDLVDHPGLLAVLDRARRLGFTGQAAPEAQIRHALGFLTAIDAAGGGAGVDVGGDGGVRGIDLGSGAGLPGLVLALALPSSRWVLVEAMERRAGPLREAVGQLGLADRVEVWCGRAEAFARADDRRGTADVVTARGFGAPAVTAECAAPLLRPGGVLAVSEPPRSEGARWPADALGRLGLSPQGVVHGVMVCRATAPCPAAYPRRVGLPTKRPLF